MRTYEEASLRTCPDDLPNGACSPLESKLIVDPLNMHVENMHHLNSLSEWEREMSLLRGEFVEKRSLMIHVGL